MSETWKPTIPRDSASVSGHPAWELWFALLGSPAPSGTKEAAELLEAYQKWYAHELAEKIRRVPVQDLPGVNPEHQHFVQFGFNRAADVIDPAVEVQG